MCRESNQIDPYYKRVLKPKAATLTITRKENSYRVRFRDRDGSRVVSFTLPRSALGALSVWTIEDKPELWTEK